MIAVPVHYRGRLSTIDLETNANRFRLVVFAPHQFVAALLADGARLASHVRRLAAFADGTPAESLHQLLIVDVEQQHFVDLLPNLFQHRAESLGLWNSAYCAVEDRSLLCRRRRHHILKNTEDHGIRNKVSPVHVGLGLAPAFRAIAHGGAQNVTRGDLGDAELRGKPVGLCSLASAGRAEQHDDHQ